MAAESEKIVRMRNGMIRASSRKTGRAAETEFVCFIQFRLQRRDLDAVAGISWF